MGKSKDLASGAAYQDQTESDTRYVNATGDTMTGALTVGGPLTVNPDADSSLLLKSGGTNAMFLTANTGDELYMGANNEYAFRIKNDGTKDVAFDNGGRVTIPSQPSFAVSKNNGHVTAGNVYIFNSTEYNIGGMYNASNGRGTVTVAGRYFVSTWLMSEADTTYNNKNYHIRINGGMFKNVYSANGGNNHHQWSWAGIMNLSANDYIDVYANNMTLYGTSGYYTSFCMHLLS